MNRRAFFRRTAGAVVGAAIAVPVIARSSEQPEKPKGAPYPSFTHREYGMSFEVSDTVLREYIHPLESE